IPTTPSRPHRASTARPHESIAPRGGLRSFGEPVPPRAGGAVHVPSAHAFLILPVPVPEAFARRGGVPADQDLRAHHCMLCGLRPAPLIPLPAVPVLRPCARTTPPGRVRPSDR